MDISLIEAWVSANPLLALGAAVLAFLLVYLIAWLIFARGFVYLTKRTRNQYDDIIAHGLRPARFAWLAPFIVLYVLAYLAPDYQAVIRKVALFFILWLSAVTVNGLISAANQIYESTPSFSGVSIQGYLDIVKLLLLLASVILSISLLTGESPVLLLSGLGALTAVLLLIFQDTILSLIASIQISSQGLIKEGDWVEVPSYDADGVVANLSLHTIKIQNWDKTITVIPTHKIREVSYKNWRGMEESGARRIMRSIHLDQTTVKFCTPQMIERYGRIDLITDFVKERRKAMLAYKRRSSKIDSPLDGPQITNIEIFRAYVEAYLRNHPDIHTTKKMDFVIRELAPTPTGLPIEVYVFTKTTNWNKYEDIQGEVFDHLLAAANYFDLRVFQEPAGSDFARVLRAK